MTYLSQSFKLKQSLLSYSNFRRSSFAIFTNLELMCEENFRMRSMESSGYTLSHACYDPRVVFSDPRRTFYVLFCDLMNFLKIFGISVSVIKGYSKLKEHNIQCVYQD